MIRIRKPSDIPAVLSSQGVRKTKELCEHFSQSVDHTRSHSGKFIYDRNIYAHSEVKEMLRQAQHNKCCYCETRVVPGGYWTIEHYRPKKSYYWLTYDWNNLLLCCPACNNNKGDLFPLTDERNRARSHLDSIEGEDPLLIHPAIEDPDIHFCFYESIMRPRTERGAKTIACLKLNRTDLEEDRREWLQKLRALLNILKLAKNVPQKFRQEVDQTEIGQIIESMMKNKYSAFARQLRKKYE